MFGGLVLALFDQRRTSRPSIGRPRTPAAPGRSRSPDREDSFRERSSSPYHSRSTIPPYAALPDMPFMGLQSMKGAGRARALTREPGGGAGPGPSKTRRRFVHEGRRQPAAIAAASVVTTSEDLIAAERPPAGLAAAEEGGAARGLSEGAGMRATAAPLDRARFAENLARRRSRIPRGIRPDIRARYREWAIDRILEHPGHPLESLLDETTGGLRAAPSRFHADLADSLGVDAVHMESRWAGGPERLALGDSWLNRAVDAAGLEHRARGGFAVNEAIDIGGVAVEKRSALLWESKGLIPRGTVANSRPHAGWTDR